ncbi:UvrD-helicase domain-containing protein [Sphingomonas swuensis]|uniref:DNA 3'-5' helicase n=1 Tax=Sphingomonas swuensis TaxID=977800 RepID=A0ABP7TEZ6_9SPHN
MIDSIEAARRHASALQESALAYAVDVWNPLEHVLWQVDQAGLVAEPTDAEASQLDGALACFLPDFRLILYRDDGSTFDKAFLIAHELGHALLGDAAGSCAIDFERSAEAAPIGEERIIEHGPKLRREMQMDLFARELLLPRRWVKALHLDERMTAEDITNKLGAPRSAVVQQLFDAMMLPEIAPPKEGAKQTKPLNDEQRDAARHRGVAYLLEAGPGTGKTQTLTARVADLLASAVDPRNILVLTFSNKAAAEMSERISGANSDAFAAMWIGTFHAFGLDLLRAFGDRLGLSQNPGLLDRTDAVAMLEDELPGLGLTHYRDIYDPTAIISDILAAISRAKDEVCDAETYRALAEAMLGKAQALSGDERDAAIIRAEEAREVAIVYARYEELKRGRNLVDFGDLVMLPVKLLEAHDDVAKHYRDKYTHVLVDEYQDVNRSSVRLLKALRPTGEGLWVVGDARQSIYRFRGASSHNITMFEADFPGAITADLVLNYRSNEEIVQLYSGFAKSMSGAGGKLKELVADRGLSGELPELRVVHDKHCIPPAIADAIAELRGLGRSYRDHCVLVSGNDRLADIGAGLEALGIPVLYLGSLFERPEIKELLSLLWLVSDPRGVGLVGTACMPEFKMTLAEVDAALSATANAGTDGRTWRDLGEDQGALSEVGRATIRLLRDALNGFDPAASPWHILSVVLLDRTRIAARIADSKEPRDVSSGLAIWQFMNFLRAQPPSWPAVPKLLARIRRLLRLADERGLRHLPAAASGIDAVRLMTIHGSKGLEFPVVHLPGLNADTMPKYPHMSRPKCPPPDGMIAGASGSAEDEFLVSHDEEQDCLFYVALSRARDRLRLYSCSHTARGTRKESSFIPRLGSDVVRLEVNPTRELPEAPSARRVPITFEPGCSWEAWHFDTYDGCPRRLLYEHILGVRGATERTPYRRVHDAVRKLCQSIAEADGVPDDAELERLAHEACDIPALAEHGYFDDFKRFATAMVQFFGDSRRDLEPVEPQSLSIEFGGDRVLVKPDDILRGVDGHVVRNIRTGHFKKSHVEKKFTARALVIAAQQAFPGSKVQVLHLADGLATDIPCKSGQEAKDRAKMSSMLASIRAGAFEAKPSAFTCPGCSALFVCDALPEGALSKKF